MRATPRTRYVPTIVVLSILVAVIGCGRRVAEQGPASPAVAASPAPSEAASAAAPTEKHLVICGTAEAPHFGSDTVYRLRDAGFSRALVADTNRYAGLTPDLFVVIADALETADAAPGAVAKAKEAGIECYAKPATAKPAPGDAPTVFLGVGQFMWGCLEPGVGFRPYPVCREKFEDGAAVLRAAQGTQVCTWANDPNCRSEIEKGLERVRATGVRKVVSEEPCGDYASFENADATGMAATPAMKRIDLDDKALAPVRKTLESKYGAKFPSLRLRNGIDIDLDGDGQTERVLDLIAGYRATENIDEQIAGDILQHVAIWKDGKPVAELFTQFAPAKVAREEYYVGHIYGSLTTLADLDGDRLVEMIVVSGYHEGEGIEVYVYRKGRLTRLVSEGCGA
ncbi:MAG: hypothetical protein IT350_08615 [Deltaproteobacteria bacterium]|nr:hypothetical protein [Deltaproteobacteria bacterium]